MLIDTVFHKEDDIGGAIWLQADVPIVGVGGGDVWATALSPDPNMVIFTLNYKEGESGLLE